ncbi:hypothetical protein [Pseudomonas sp. KCJK8993]|uniref:hypothetical protein n=1 Tax=Pseudomonas sp. KCJK8993 TaxID=3344565 RepID=UPI0039067BC7
MRDAQSSPREQLERLLELPHHGQTAKEAASIELGIRAWARQDKQARQAIDEVDSHRLSYIEGLLIQIGISADQAKDRAYLIYAYQVSLSLVHTQIRPAEHQQRNLRITQLLVS